MPKTWAEPWVVHEDDDLLAVHKPAGINTHRADPRAQDGMYEWVGRQRPHDSLSILHRLDKATSGVLLFGKTPDANRSLTAQFEQRLADKSYALLASSKGPVADRLTCDLPVGGSRASTEFSLEASGTGVRRYTARPHTGRTHQVRIHAQALGIPIVGDDEHGGAAAARLFLHAAHLGVAHPGGSSIDVTVEPPPSFVRCLTGEDPGGASLNAVVAHEARAALLDPEDTNAYVWVDRRHDGFPEIRIERLGDVALVLDYRDRPSRLPRGWLDAMHACLDLRGVYVQHRPRGGGGGTAEPVTGAAAPQFDVTELGVVYRIDLTASATSTGLFLDQRETRRELLASDLRGRTVLNAFAHTGSLSVAAALAGAETLSLDLSERYLDWARDNLRLNDVDPGGHDFIYGDAMEWMGRLAKKGRRFDLVVVDPPSSSTSRKGRSKRWSVDRDLGMLVERAAVLCATGGSVFVSTNFRRMAWPRFLDHLRRGLDGAGRTGAVETRTLPLDHRSGSGDPPYLKAAWLRLDRT